MNTIRILYVFMLILLIASTGCICVASDITTNDASCHFDEQRRNDVLRKINFSFSEFRTNRILVEIGDTNYRSYDYLFLGLNKERGVIYTDSPYWVEGDNKTYRSERIIDADIGAMKALFEMLHEIIGRVAETKRESSIDDGSCYIVKINAKNLSTKFSVYAPMLFPHEGIKMAKSDAIVSTIYKFFEMTEINNKRFIRKKTWAQRLKQ